MLDDQPRIIARLKDRVPEVHGRVQPIGDLKDCIKNQQPTPGLFVFYNNYRPVDGLGALDAHWIVVVRDRTASQRPDAADVLAEGLGPIVDGVLAALVNWCPERGRHPMQLARPGVSAGWLDGYVYLPLGFFAGRVYSFPRN